MSALLLAQYSMATFKLVVVDIGASSVPPSERNSSGISALRIPRQRSTDAIAPSSEAPIARNRRTPSSTKETVMASGCGPVRLVSRSGPLIDL
eukprot:scaffold15704_cov36-Phaeocystis_antarctica.AAC.1